MTRRMLSIWLPQLAIERWLRARGAPSTTPDVSAENAPTRHPLVVLTETGTRGTLITAAAKPAHRLGIGPGMRLTDARAVCPALGVALHDRSADAAMLRMMADAMLRFTPWVALDGTDGLLLDVTGCAHLQGGEASLARAIEAVFARAGFTAQLGIAGTLGAAWAIARHAPKDKRIITEDSARTALAPLPTAALRLLPETQAGLTRLGLKTISDLEALDRVSLLRRFPPGKNDPGPVARLDQAFGRRDEPLSPRAEAPDYRVRVAPLEPLIDLAGITHHFAPLLSNLMALLTSDGRGARRLALHAFRTDGPVIHLTVGLARASCDESHITRLFTEKLDQIDPGFGIDTLMLSAEVTEPLETTQTPLEPSRQSAGPDALERLVDRIANRTGPDSIYRLAAVNSHTPDRAACRSTATHPTDWTQTLAPLRPLTLLARPEAIAVMAEIPEGPPVTFRWRRVLHRVTRATGPERLAPEWWRDLADTLRTRDYYAIEDMGGGRYWLFRDGLYHEAEQRGTPEWFLHGIFA